MRKRLFLSATDVRASAWQLRSLFRCVNSPRNLKAQFKSRVASISLDGRHVSMGSQDKNGTTVGVTVSTATGAQEGVDTQLGDTYDHGARWMPDGRSVATVDIRSGTLNLWSGAIPTCWCEAGKPTGPTKQLTHFTSGVIWDYGWSPDGKFIALARGTDQSDAVLFTSAK